MSGFLVCAPLGIEARALRRGLGDDAEVRHTGMGQRRSARFAARLAESDSAGVLAVAGTCGGLVTDLAPGDLVIGSAVIVAAEPLDAEITCPSAPLLAGELRRAGLRARTGRIATADRIVRGSQRQRLAETGAIAADMESATLLRAAGDRPHIVLRAVSDGRGHGAAMPGRAWSRGEGDPFGPGGPLGAAAALRSLRLAGPALARWAAACGDRRILLAAPRSFCAGVERAIGIVEHVLDHADSPVYVRKQIVHNGRVVSGLARRGAVFVEELDEVPDGARVVFSAHGISPAVRAQAEWRGLRPIDATCPLVAKVHAEARRFAADGYLIVLIGHADHEEVEGTFGEAPDSIVVVSNSAEVEALRPDDPERIVYLTQTTLPPDDTADIVTALRGRFPAAHGPGSDDICYATANRQDALRGIAVKSDLVLVAGSPNSSNSLRLVETARRAGAPAHLVEGPEDIELGWLAGAETVGITAGASTPPAVVDEIVAALAGLGPVTVSEHVTAIESIQFGLPKEARAL